MLVVKKFVKINSRNGGKLNLPDYLKAIVDIRIKPILSSSAMITINEISTDFTAKDGYGDDRFTSVPISNSREITFSASGQYIDFIDDKVEYITIEVELTLLF